jgi:hypothetical protein
MSSLSKTLARVRRRVLSLGAARGIVWGLIAATVLLLLGAWLDLLWEFSPGWRIATLWTAGVVALLAAGALAAASVRAARAAALARRLDRTGQAGGRIFTGWELEEHRYGVSGESPPLLTAGLAELAVMDAVQAAARVSVARTVPLRPVTRGLTGLAVLWAVAAVPAILLPGLAWTQWNRFFRPLADVPPFSLTKFEVTPDKADVTYGDELEIRAKAIGAPVDQVELVLQTAQGRELLPMFPEPDGQWRVVLASVVEPGEYFVQAHRARSAKCPLGVNYVPRIESARVRTTPPAYTHRAPYEGPLPKDGVSGLPGAKVKVFLRSNRPLRGGSIALWCGAPAAAAGSSKAKQKPPAATGQPGTLAMTPCEPGSNEATGEFSITADGRFECRVIDETGRASRESFVGNIILLADQRPFIRITQPERMSLATPEAAVPVVLTAEDDYGISRLQLYRSLNNSRPLSVDLPLPPRQTCRLDHQSILPLAQYGLQPGDVIKLFGRVEDNDPAGAKGAESPVAAVRIVSQEDFERLVRNREGIEAVLSKYYAARRQLESLAEEIKKLRDKLQKSAGDEKLSAEIRRELRRLQQRMRQEAAAMGKSLQHKLPYDLDTSLAPHLRQMMAMTEAMAKELEKFENDPAMTGKRLDEELQRLARRLVADRGQYEELVTKPLEYFEAVLPLVLDQERFVMLAQWQQDLAERAAALKGRDGQDDPALKARMRELEEEQRQIREALGKFLESLREHIDKLPERPELTKLRQTARKFAADVSASGASEAMTAAETAFADFSPTRGYEKAKQAADILAKFIKHCNSMGQGGQDALAGFQPTLGSGLGNTLAQLLAQLGNSGGMDNGPMGGYGAVGLYGGLPDMFGAMGAQGDATGAYSSGGSARFAKKGGGNPDTTAPGETATPDATAGASEGAVPERYRRKVGQYFQRVAEETKEGQR